MWYLSRWAAHFSSKSKESIPNNDFVKTDLLATARESLIIHYQGVRWVVSKAG